MKKAFVAGLAAAAVLSVASVAQAQSWPTRGITFVVPFAAGGGTDAFARPLAAQLDQQLGQRIIIENKAGAGGTVGASAASKAKPDGYTFFVGAAHHAIAPAIYPKLDYDIMKDFVAVGVMAAPVSVKMIPFRSAGACVRVFEARCRGLCCRIECTLSHRSWSMMAACSPG